MIIKQKKHQNRGLVEYTEKELDVLMNVMAIFWLIGIIVSAFNAIVSAITLSASYEDSVLLVLFGVAIVVAILIWIMKPILRIVLRHLSIPLPTRFEAIDNALIKWYTEARFFAVIMWLCVGIALNIASFWFVNKHGRGGAYGTFVMGLSSVVLSVLWIIAAALSDKAERADLEVVHDNPDEKF